MTSHGWLVFFSILSSSLLILSLISLTFIFYDLKSFYDESIEDMDTFTMYAERAWTEMKSSPSTSSPSSSLSPSILYGRHPRSAAICQCGPLQTVACPDGPPGQSGVPGEPGSAGQPGPNGDDAAPTTAYGQPCPKPACFSCPDGPPGRPGDDGLAGNDGPPGAPGFPGDPGTGARMGPTGPPGDKGAPGRDGEPGLNGPPGASARTGKGQSGLSGQNGSMGPTGPAGRPGKRAPDGIPGPQGPPGREGTRGIKGVDGQLGRRGEMGETGTDGQYCQCPKRNNEYGVRNYAHGGAVSTRKRSGDVYRNKNTVRGYEEATVFTMRSPIRYHDQREALIIDGGDSD